MRKITIREALLAICVGMLAAGCDIKPGTWQGMPSAVVQVIQAIHDGTGWVLDKGQVSIKRVSQPIPSDGSLDYRADFQINVKHSGSEFETVAANVPCDVHGIPTEASVTMLREAVKDIKSKIKKLQD